MNFVPALVLVASLTAVQPVAPRIDPPAGLRGSITDVARLAAHATPLPRAALAVAPAPKQSKGRSFVGLVLGGAVGLWAGGAIGYQVEHKVTDGRCYDVCFTGLLIGAPIGAVVGGILGWKLF